ncbi:hypothetical protein BKA70DRAFT_1578028 [Coprinopsis sp. MPI-PUGE-AT-0042]|nr:hypothetical protein BKA70DRAFT_1578028 [Coprinopsis sp. MPI-PUGE-AT-0042]
MSWAGIWICSHYKQDSPGPSLAPKFPPLSSSSPLAKTVANAPRRLLRCLCAISALRSFLEETVRS